MATQIALTKFIADVKSADLRDDQRFYSLFGQAVDVLQLLDKDVAREFGASRPTVTRWRNGINAPHPAVRKAVYDWLEQRASTVARRAARQALATASRVDEISQPVELAALRSR